MHLPLRCLLGTYTCACTVCSSEDGAESTPEEPEIVDEAVYVFRGHTGTCARRLQQLYVAKRGGEQLVAADAVFAVAWSPAQEGLVATGGGDDRAFLWQVGRRFRDQHAPWRASVLGGPLTSSEPLAVQVGAEQGSADTELGGHSDSVSSPFACMWHRLPLCHQA